MSTARPRAAGLLAAASLLAFGLAGCGSSGGMGSSASPVTAQGCSSATCSSTMITLTDASGDFDSYTVDVTSLTLTKADKTVVETLSVKTRVDFTQLVNVTEFLTAASVPNGDYVAATMTVDYSNAAVFVDVNGTPTQATLVDSSGNPLTTLQLTVQLDDAHHLVVAAGKLAHLALDFNLAASNSVDLTKTPPVVTVKPLIVASIVPLDSKELRVRGALVSVGSTSYTVKLEPFEDADTDRGTAVVNTTATTTFEINGSSYAGAAGLAALNIAGAGTLTVAFGSFDPGTRNFTATRVLAGSSLVRSGEPRLMGTVIARSGTTLTVRGGHLDKAGGGGDEFVPHDVQLTIGSATMVTRVDDPGTAPTIADLSVGSAVTAFGVSGTGSGGPTFDATAGRVRIEFSRVAGLVVGSGNSGVILNLQTINGLPAGAFSFVGTGSSAATDSDPAHYRLATSSQAAVTGLVPGTPLAAIGFVHAYQSAPPDFDAHTLINFASVSARLEVRFAGGSSAPFTTLDASGLVIDLASPPLGAEHDIRIGPQVIDLTTLPASPHVVPDPQGGAFAIAAVPTPGSMTPTMIMAFDTYAAFETALAADVAAARRVQAVAAVGAYDSATNTFTARSILIGLGN